MRHLILVGDDPARQTEPGWPAGRAVDDASHNGFSHRDTATAAIYLDDDLGIEGSLQNGRKILLPLAGPLDCRSAPAENGLRLVGVHARPHSQRVALGNGAGSMGGRMMAAGCNHRADCPHADGVHQGRFLDYRLNRSACTSANVRPSPSSTASDLV